jgi:hypothetical protein
MTGMKLPKGSAEQLNATEEFRGMTRVPGFLDFGPFAFALRHGESSPFR